MRIAMLVVAVLLALVGLVFLLQGVGILPGSFMTGQLFWAFVGFVLLVVGGGLAFTSYRMGNRV